MPSIRKEELEDHLGAGIAVEFEFAGGDGARGGVFGEPVTNWSVLCVVPADVRGLHIAYRPRTSSDFTHRSTRMMPEPDLGYRFRDMAAQCLCQEDGDGVANLLCDMLVGTEKGVVVRERLKGRRFAE